MTATCQKQGLVRFCCWRRENFAAAHCYRLRIFFIPWERSMPEKNDEVVASVVLTSETFLSLYLPGLLTSDESGYPKIEPNRPQIGKYCKALEWLNTEHFSKNVSNFNAKLFAP